MREIRILFADNSEIKLMCKISAVMFDKNFVILKLYDDDSKRVITYRQEHIALIDDKEKA